MRIILITCLLAVCLSICGCASQRSEGTAAASYGGITVAATWKVER